MGGHVAEKLVIGNEKISSGCGSDLQGATNLATYAVRQCGMFGDLVGYNSTEAKDASDVYNALIKILPTVSQTKLGRTERRTNVAKAFALNPQLRLNFEARYVVVDDVLTTGATLHACAHVLRKAGIKNVDALALAHG
jgi:hypothetical protein